MMKSASLLDWMSMVSECYLLSACTFMCSCEHYRLCTNNNACKIICKKFSMFKIMSISNFYVWYLVYQMGRPMADCGRGPAHGLSLASLIWPASMWTTSSSTRFWGKAALARYKAKMLMWIKLWDFWFRNPIQAWVNQQHLVNSCQVS